MAVDISAHRTPPQSQTISYLAIVRTHPVEPALSISPQTQRVRSLKNSSHFLLEGARAELASRVGRLDPTANVDLIGQQTGCRTRRNSMKTQALTRKVSGKLFRTFHAVRN